MIDEKKIYWDEDILRIKNEVRRHELEIREGVTDEDAAEADAEPDKNPSEATVIATD